MNGSMAASLTTLSSTFPQNCFTMNTMKACKDERHHNIIVSYVKNGKGLRCLELKVAHCIKYLSGTCATENLQVNSKCYILTLCPIAIENIRNNLGSSIFQNVTTSLTRYEL